MFEAHGTTLVDEYVKLHGRRQCACGCGGATTWHGWRKGFSTSICGHNGNIYSFYDHNKATAISERRRAALRGKQSWAKGLTKETDKRIARRAKLSTISKRRTTSCARGSRGQTELSKFVESLGFTVGNNVRGIIGNKELDIFLPEHLFAIEYNDLYLHSERFKSSTYHEEKSSRCEAIGLSLMHVFEDEWVYKRKIVESIIKNRLNVPDKRIDVGSCTVRTIDRNTSDSFFDECHLDGKSDVSGQSTIALFNNEELVYAIATTNGEVLRCCPALGTNVPGGLVELLKQRPNVNSIIVDERLGSTNSALRSAGFSPTNETTHRSWWTDYDSRYDSSLCTRDEAGTRGLYFIHGCSVRRWKRITTRHDL
jgi:hypothetical protein